MTVTWTKEVVTEMARSGWLLDIKASEGRVNRIGWETTECEK